MTFKVEFEAFPPAEGKGAYYVVAEINSGCYGVAETVEEAVKELLEHLVAGLTMYGLADDSELDPGAIELANWFREAFGLTRARPIAESPTDRESEDCPKSSGCIWVFLGRGGESRCELGGECPYAPQEEAVCELLEKG